VPSAKVAGSSLVDRQAQTIKRASIAVIRKLQKLCKIFGSLFLTTLAGGAIVLYFHGQRKQIQNFSAF